MAFEPIGVERNRALIGRAAAPAWPTIYPPLGTPVSQRRGWPLILSALHFDDHLRPLAQGPQILKTSKDA